MLKCYKEMAKVFEMKKKVICHNNFMTKQKEKAASCQMLTKKFELNSKDSMQAQRRRRSEISEDMRVKMIHPQK